MGTRLTARELAKGAKARMAFDADEYVAIVLTKAWPQKAWMGYRVQTWLGGMLVSNLMFERLDEAYDEYEQLVRTHARALAERVLAA